MAKVNIIQKLVVTAGAVLVGLRVLYPVQEKGVGGMGFSLEQGFFQNVDWNMTLLHIGGIVAVTIAAYVIFKKR